MTGSGSRFHDASISFQDTSATSGWLVMRNGGIGTVLDQRAILSYRRAWDTHGRAQKYILETEDDPVGHA